MTYGKLRERGLISSGRGGTKTRTVAAGTEPSQYHAARHRQENGLVRKRRSQPRHVGGSYGLVVSKSDRM